VSKPYSGPYQDRTELRPEDIEAVMESEGMALSEVMTMLRSLSENVAALTQDVTSLTAEFRSYKWAVPVIVGLGIAFISIIVAIK